MKSILAKILVFLLFLFAVQIAFGQDSPKARLIESATIGVTTGEELSLYIDMLLNELSASPNSIGYIIIYGGKINKVGEIEAHVRGINRAFYFKKVDKSRIKIIQGGFREKFAVDFWAVPENACSPLPTPTIEIERVKFRGVSKKIVNYDCGC